MASSTEATAFRVRRSAKLLEGRSPVVLGEELLNLPEEKQVEIILPLVARVVLKAKHGYEETPEMDQFWKNRGASLQRLVGRVARHIPL